MSCDREGRLIWFDGRQIGVIANMVASFRVDYDRHLFHACHELHNADDGEYAWTLDAETFLRYRHYFSIMEFHVVKMGVDLIFRISGDRFAKAGHSSRDCDSRQSREKWHCPWRFFEYDKALLALYPPPPLVPQGALL